MSNILYIVILVYTLNNHVYSIIFDKNIELQIYGYKPNHKCLILSFTIDK